MQYFKHGAKVAKKLELLNDDGMTQERGAVSMQISVAKAGES